MRRVASLCWILLASSTLVAAADLEPGPFAVDTLAPGVWLFRVPADSPAHTNSLVVDAGEGLLVVESQPSPPAARQLQQAIAGVSDKPIVYLVLGQSAAASSGGASAFDDSVVVIASKPTRDDLRDDAADLGGEARLRANDPESWTAPPRVLPDLAIGGPIEVGTGEHLIELLPIARAQVRGAIVARIEALGLYYIGPMIVGDRNPYADIERTDMHSWIRWLNSLAMQHPRIVVPLRGETLDEEATRTFSNALAWVVFQVEAEFEKEAPVDEIVDRAMDKPELAEHFDVDAKPFLAPTLFERARLDSLEQRRKRFVDYEKDRTKPETEQPR